MIERIGASIVPKQYSIPQKAVSNAQTEKTTVPSFGRDYTATSLVNAYQALYGIKPAKTVSFGAGLAKTIEELRKPMFTCRDEEAGKNGEAVGSRIDVTGIIKKHMPELPFIEDAIKTNVIITPEDKEIKSQRKERGFAVITEARTQLKRVKGGILYEIAVRQPRPETEEADKSKSLIQRLRFIQNPTNGEIAYALKTKGKLMAVVEDKDDVILTNAGSFEIIDSPTNDTKLSVNVETKGNKFEPFEVAPQEVEERKQMPSKGEGTEIVIGMEDGRFVPEIIDSIKEFTDKIDKGEIILPQFKANPEARNTQLAMLAGGFGSRAEYTNASSDGIFHGTKDGANSTKGVFRTATGLTPMETTFVSLHLAGLLDCSKGIEIGKNIKLYLNKSGKNSGNGGFTLDLYNKMEREGRKSLSIFPNDSMSRMSNASKKMADIMNTGDAAIAMIAKQVKAEDAKGNFGIMKLGDNNEILEFAEKPKEIPDGYISGKNSKGEDMCLTNTFQFSVSKEAFKAISLIEQYIPEFGKESRDWSKTFVPIIMHLSQIDDAEKSREAIARSIRDAMRAAKVSPDFESDQIPLDTIIEAKKALNGQKIYAVPTDEPWADCGTLNALYHTTMQIASNDFPLLDFERKHVLDSINTNTGLVASTPEQKQRIESKYDINGQVMVVPKAKKVPKKIVKDYIEQGLITVNE